jgi:hypothetical protein
LGARGCGPEGEEAERKEDVVPELVGQTPESAVGAEDGDENALHEEEVTEEGGRGQEPRDITQHMIVNLAAVESRGVAEVHSKLVPEKAEEQSRDENDPQTCESAREVVGPEPLIAFDGADYSTADEESTQNEEDNDGLMPCPGQYIGDGEECAMGGEIGEVHEEEVAAVFKKDEESSDCTQQVEEN